MGRTGTLELQVSALVTSYNSWDLARESVRANLDLHPVHPEDLRRVVLLDDASPSPPPFESDGSFEIVRNARNLGFAASLNHGIRALGEAGSDIVVHWDADARPLRPYVDEVRRAFAADPSLALLGFSTCGAQGPTPSWDKEPGALSLVLGQALYARFQKRIEAREKRVCPWACALAVRVSAFEDLGGFDEGFDLLDVDIDLAMRAHRSRWSVRSCPSLLAFHEGGGTPMLVSGRLLRFYAARWLLLQKHRKMRSPTLCKALILLRLRLELALLLAMGRKRFSNNEVLQDKIEGRRKIIRYCKENY